ncbi:tyrosine-type recombinase/integrase [Bradyrhizobium liaoningense]|uniref:tyrosine-type recombinase/integrase n=1 Tax=Bradyrhizobium liaoningense TaxID=43992 RepID=UPI0004B722ED|nr:site-specific integrase [Bradyrhizobium liaoningense]
MPTYTLRQHDNEKWYIHWTEGRRSRRVSTGQKEEAKAQTFLARWILGEQQDATDEGAKFLVSELWQLYYERHVEKNNANVRTADTVWRNLAVHFGAMTLAEVDSAVEDYISLRQDGAIGNSEAAPATIRHELSRLKACFNWCAAPKQKIMRPADVPVFDLPPDSDPRTRWLRTEEIQKLLDAAVEHRKANQYSDGARLSRAERFLWLALETGTRLQAALDLTWDRIDFETGNINFNVPGRKKTKKRRTTVPISAALRPILLRAYAERAGDLVLDNKSLSIWRMVKAIAKRAKVEGVSPHVLRHTAATHMLRNRVPVWQVAGVLGVTVQMIEKIYGHHVPDGLLGAVDSISGGSLEPAE